jgi:hypothetical protein
MELYVKECVDKFVIMGDGDKNIAVKNLYEMRDGLVDSYIPMALILTDYFAVSWDKTTLLLCDSIVDSKGFSHSPARVFSIATRLMDVYFDRECKSEIISVCKRILRKLSRMEGSCVSILAIALDIASRGYVFATHAVNVNSDIPVIRKNVVVDKTQKKSIDGRNTDVLDTRLARLISSLLHNDEIISFSAYVTSRINPPFDIMPIGEYDLPRSGITPRDSAICRVFRESAHWWPVFEVLSQGMKNDLIG